MSGDTRPVMVGYFDSAEGRAALLAAVEEAGRRGTHLVAAHSTIDDDAPTGEEVARSVTEIVGADTGVTIEFREVKGGRDVSEALLELARQIDASVLVIGIRRRSPVGKLIMGSTAQRILLDADCAVLAVKA